MGDKRVVMLDRGLLTGRRNVWYLVQSVVLLVLFYQADTLAAPAANTSHTSAGSEAVVVVKEGIHKLGFNETHHEHALVFPGEFPHHKGKFMHNSKLTKEQLEKLEKFRQRRRRAPMVFLFLLVVMVTAQVVLFTWRKQHYQSYQKATLAGLWLFPFLFSDYFRLFFFNKLCILFIMR